MRATSDDIEIQLQKGMWMIVLLVPVFALFTIEMQRLEIAPIWWVPALALMVVASLAAPFVRPVSVVFRPGDRTLQVTYRLGIISKRYSFEQLDSIRSYVRIVGEADSYVDLEVRTKAGVRLSLICLPAAWDKFAILNGFSGAREPQELTELRRRISSATGIRDLGFCN